MGIRWDCISMSQIVSPILCICQSDNVYPLSPFSSPPNRWFLIRRTTRNQRPTGYEPWPYRSQHNARKVNAVTGRRNGGAVSKHTHERNFLSCKFYTDVKEASWWEVWAKTNCLETRSLVTTSLPPLSPRRNTVRCNIYEHIITEAISDTVYIKRKIMQRCLYRQKTYQSLSESTTFVQRGFWPSQHLRGNKPPYLQRRSKLSRLPLNIYSA
jgi:hypothetical protein